MHSLTRFLLLATILTLSLTAWAAPVTLLRTPNGGIQPQALMDAKGVLHLLYFKGAPGGGDLFYVRQEPGSDAFSTPLRVNSQPGSAIATGTIRGGQLALGQNGRVHVAWNGAPGALPKGPLNPELPANSPHNGTPLLYARLNDAGTAFEAQRNLMQIGYGLDGGGTIAADAQGHVYVAWHAHPPGGITGEGGRVVFLARSSDDGATFEREKPINPQPTGACGCCQMRAFVDANGALYLLYRAAVQEVDRDMILLMAAHPAAPDAKFSSAALQPWKVDTCPMSSESFVQNRSRTRGGVVGAWETKGQVFWSLIDPVTGQAGGLVAAPAATDKRQHPALAANAAGETLLAWTEGTGWNRGGALAWQVWDAAGRPTPEKGQATGVPVWSLLTAFARPDGGFVVVY